MNAMTDAVRKRKRTWPSVRARRKASTRSTGRPTSWIQRGIWIVVGRGRPSSGSYRGAGSRLRLAFPNLNLHPCYGPGNDDSALTACGQAACQQATGSGESTVVRGLDGGRRGRRRDAAPDGVRRQRRAELRRSSGAGSAARDLGSARAAGARDRRQPARAVARRAGRCDGGRVPRLGRGRARAPSRRAAGERGTARAPLAQDHRLLAGGAAPGISSRAARCGRSTWERSRGPMSTRRSTAP